MSESKNTGKNTRTKKEDWNWPLLKKMGLNGTDSDFDDPAYDKSLGRDKHGRPMLTIPDDLLVNQPPRRTREQYDQSE